MPAYEIPNLRFSGAASGAITIRRFVVVNADETYSQAAAEGISVVGVSANDPADGEVLDVYDGIVMVEAGGAVNAGDNVMTDVEGRAVAYTPNPDVNGVPQNTVAGYAITSAGAAGELVTIKL